MIGGLKIIAVILGLAGATIATFFLQSKVKLKKPFIPTKQMEEFVKKTEIGEKIIDVLGEQAEAGKNLPRLVPTSITPLNLETIPGKVSQIVTEKTSQEIGETLKKLPPEQLEAVKKIICQPQ